MATREYTAPTRKGCNRCGSKSVAWQQNEAGKWYLTEVFEDTEGRTYTESRLFHSLFCKDGGALHAKEQANRISIDSKAKRETAKNRKAREDRNATEEAAYFLELHDLCKTQRDQAIDQLAAKERELEGLNSNWTSSDHFVDSLREKARVQRLTAEIAFMKAALGMATEYDDE